MTPLLQAIVKDLVRPRRKQQLTFSDIDRDELQPMLDEVQSFECTAVYPLARRMAERFFESDDDALNNRTAFLPAARTWIEVSLIGQPEHPGGGRWAWLLIDDGRSNEFAKCIWLAASKIYNHVWAIDKNAGLPLTTLASLSAAAEMFDVGKITNRDDYRSNLYTQLNREKIREWELPNDPALHQNLAATYIAAEIYALLGFINTPRVFQRHAHDPHSGLQRELLAAKPLVGKYPLGAWTEILLKVPAPASVGGSLSQGFMTGERALHWCRAHLRYRLGQWEIVTDHWRGNPEIGIKRSRYRVEAGHNNHTDDGGGK